MSDGTTNQSLTPSEGPYHISRPDATEDEMRALFPAFSKDGLASADLHQRTLLESFITGDEDLLEAVLRDRQRLFEQQAELANTEHASEKRRTGVSAANTAQPQSEDHQHADNTEQTPSTNNQSNEVGDDSTTVNDPWAGRLRTRPLRAGPPSHLSTSSAMTTASSHPASSSRPLSSQNRPQN